MRVFGEIEGIAVGTEFASYYADMGADVTVLEYLPGLVPLEDGDIRKEMERAFKKRGIYTKLSAHFGSQKRVNLGKHVKGKNRLLDTEVWDRLKLEIQVGKLFPEHDLGGKPSHGDVADF